jgi:peptidoglycan/LPS O-acetylase OafA/YrhL
MDEIKKYLPGIDALRAIGALSVIIGHIELSKFSFGIKNVKDSIPFFKYTSGHLGVILFFVISGFLITYLMLVEKNNFKQVNIKKFYIRRILRIWPIYFLIILLLIFVFPKIINIDYYGKINSFSDLNFTTILMYLFLVPNLVVFGINGIGGGYHLGTIGTEEQFYLIWPILFKYFNNLFIPLMFIFISITLAPHISDFINFNYIKNIQFKQVFFNITNFFNHFKINCMALGGLFSYIYYLNKSFILKFLYSNIVQLVSFILGFGLWILGFHLSYFNDEFYAILFSIIILNLSTNPNSLLKLDNKMMNFLGKISYGMYIYHWIIIYMIIDLLNKFELDIMYYNILLYLLTLLVTILISYLSYKYFESYFLKLKSKFY